MSRHTKVENCDTIINRVDLEIFNIFISMAMRRTGEKDKLLELVKRNNIRPRDKVDFLNRMMNIFLDIPIGIFPDASVRIKLLTDYRLFIEELTMEDELGEEYEREIEEPTFDELLDMFDLD